MSDEMRIRQLEAQVASMQEGFKDVLHLIQKYGHTPEWNGEMQMREAAINALQAHLDGTGLALDALTIHGMADTLLESYLKGDKKKTLTTLLCLDRRLGLAVIGTIFKRLEDRPEVRDDFWKFVSHLS
jgi:hypothetical protein